MGTFPTRARTSHEGWTPLEGWLHSGALVASLLPGLQRSFGYEMQKSRFGRRGKFFRRTITRAVFAALPVRA